MSEDIVGGHNQAVAAAHYFTTPSVVSVWHEHLDPVVQPREVWKIETSGCVAQGWGTFSVCVCVRVCVCACV